MPAPPAHHRVVADPVTGAPLLVKRAGGDAGRARLAAEAAVLDQVRDLPVVRPTAHLDDGWVAELHLAWVGPHSLATVAGVPLEVAAGLIARVAETVAGLHARGLVHRALRPDHVLLAADGSPVLTGLAHARTAGSPGDDGSITTPADDVAALGALLAWLVQPSAEAAMIPDRRRRRSGDAGLRGTLLTLADRASADDPAARPSAATFAADLHALVPRSRSARRGTGARHPSLAAGPSGSASPTGGRHPRPPDRPGAPPPRSPRVPVGAIVAFVALTTATLGAAAWWTVGDDATEATGPPSTGQATVDPGPGRPTSAPSASSPTSAPEAPPPSTRPAPPTTTAAPPTTPPDSPCAAVAPPRADVDGDGCPDALRIRGERVTVGSTTWVVGRPGDLPAVGDWDCDGIATVALLRPDTGEVFVFRSWARPGTEVTVTPATVVAGADGIVADDADGDGCATLLATRAGRPAVAVPLGATQ